MRPLRGGASGAVSAMPRPGRARRGVPRRQDLLQACGPGQARLRRIQLQQAQAAQRAAQAQLGQRGRQARRRRQPDRRARRRVDCVHELPVLRAQHALGAPDHPSPPRLRRPGAMRISAARAGRPARVRPRSLLGCRLSHIGRLAVLHPPALCPAGSRQGTLAWSAPRPRHSNPDLGARLRSQRQRQVQAGHVGKVGARRQRERLHQQRGARQHVVERVQQEARLHRHGRLLLRARPGSGACHAGRRGARADAAAGCPQDWLRTRGHRAGAACAGRRCRVASPAGRSPPHLTSALLSGVSSRRPQGARHAYRAGSGRRRAPPQLTALLHGAAWARGRRACARSASRSQGHSSAWLQAASCGGRRHRRCPATSTTPGGPARAARYSASVSHGVAASAVGPKLVGPARTRAARLTRWPLCVLQPARTVLHPSAPTRRRGPSARPRSSAEPGLASHRALVLQRTRRLPRDQPLLVHPSPCAFAGRHSMTTRRRQRAWAARRQRQRRVRQRRDRVRVGVGAPGRPGGNGSGGYGSGEMGTTAAYAWLSTRAAAAGARPARLSRRSSSTGRPPAAPRTQRSTTASALPPAGAAP